MILIAPDKYRGTLSARQAAEIMSASLPGPKLVMPMADGGEGTAECVADTPEWRYISEGCFYNPFLKHLILDSSAIVGHNSFSADSDPMCRNTSPLGHKLNEVYEEFKPFQIYLGVGGTATCDGGAGLLETLIPRVNWKGILKGLVDVRVPLLPRYPGEKSALSFCLQKGFRPEQLPEVERRLAKVVKRYGIPASPFDGSGGGLGYALATVIGAECYNGAEWIISHKNIDWSEITLAVTGEGKYDRQSETGKVVSVIYDFCRPKDIPVICVAGCVEKNVKVPEGLELIDSSRFGKGEKLSPEVAAKRIADALEYVQSDSRKKSLLY